MAEPRRIQRKRVKGWRLPAGARCVTRPGTFGNPFVPQLDAAAAEPFWYVRIHRGPERLDIRCYDDKDAAVVTSVVFFDRWLRDPHRYDFPTLRARRARILAELPKLAGLDLACYCPLPADGETDWCHAAVLLRLSAEAAGGSDV